MPPSKKTTTTDLPALVGAHLALAASAVHVGNDPSITRFHDKTAWIAIHGTPAERRSVLQEAIDLIDAAEAEGGA